MQKDNLDRGNVEPTENPKKVVLEHEFWDALDELCTRENLPSYKVSWKSGLLERERSFESAVRAYVLSYFRSSDSTLITSNISGNQPE